jgi:4-amino-4-deoxy-L-arabinose transferase-like glycosyltransferase
VVLADLMDVPAAGAASARARRRWEVWRSPPGQPPWARPVLLGIAAVAALLYAWNITSSGLAPYYSVAVKSMSESWKAFFFGAFDPNATITIDKLAGSFLPQALSARIFGFHAWSLALPQVIEGVISVLVMYRVVRRWAGVVPGLVAAGIFTLTPIAASMFGHSMEDGALTMCLVLAADCYQRAVTESRPRSLIWSGVWVGLGFQAKMLQAWMVLPALGIGYLICAPAPLRRRAWQVGVAGVVMLAVSMAWIALYTFTPANDRPYVDGSANNSAIAMVFGYNGLDRFGITVAGAVTSASEGTTGGGSVGSGSVGSGPGSGSVGNRPGSGSGGGAPRGTGRGGSPQVTSLGSGASGWAKLLGSKYGPEIGWLYPLAVLTVVFGLLWTRRTTRSDQLRAGFVFWGLWLLTYGLIFSEMSTIPHAAYLATLALPLAALSGTGIVMFWRTFQEDGWRGWVLPAVVAVQVAWTLFLWRSYGGFLPWARDVILVAGVIAVLTTIAMRLSGRTRTRLATVALAAGVAAVIAAPGAWAASVLDTAYGGRSFEASAGPAGGSLDGSGGDATTALSSPARSLYDYVSSHRDGASYLMAVESPSLASPFILATGQEVMDMGGLSGSVPEPTLARAKELVSSGQLRFFLLGVSGTGTGSSSGTDSPSSTIDAWVASACSTVPATNYGGSAAFPSSGYTLYACSRSG